MYIYTYYDTLHNFCKNIIDKIIKNETYKPYEGTSEELIESYHGDNEDDDIFVEMVNEFIDDEDIYIREIEKKKKYSICIKTENLEKFLTVCKKITNKDVRIEDIEM